MPKKTLVIVSGPSGVGKTTIVNELLSVVPSSARLITTTTRAPRPGEENGKDYYFVAREDFLAGAERGEFIEWVESYGDLYGSSRARLAELFEAHSVIFVAPDTRGVFSLKDEFPLAPTIFIRPGSAKELERRIIERGGTDQEKVRRRLAAIAEKMAQAHKFDYVVENPEGRAREAVGETLAIVQNHSVWRIGLDLDGVIIDHSGSKVLAAKNLGVELRENDTPSNVLKEKVPPDVYRKIKNAVYDVAAYINAPCAQSAAGGVSWLKRGWPLYLISAQPEPGMAISWLKRNGFWHEHFDSENAFFVESRSGKDAVARKLLLDVYLDDEASVLELMPSVPHRFLLDPFDAYPENQNYAKVGSWREFIEKIVAL